MMSEVDRIEMSKILAEKMGRQYIPPTEMFRRQPVLYSQFDSHGVPTHDACGNELSKSTMKKLHKDWLKQKKLFELFKNLERNYVPPTEMFRRQPVLYSLFDSDGVPTHDSAGNELDESTIQQLREEWEKAFVA